MKPPIHLKGRCGLGDAIYMRPIVRAFSQTHNLYLTTAWPELYSDLPVRFVAPRVNQRVVVQSLARHGPSLWVKSPVRAQRIHYQWESLSSRGILGEIEYRAGIRLERPRLDLPELGESPVSGERIAVVRPVTIRSDWPNPSRNPDPSYLDIASRILMDSGFHVVSVADADPVEEPIIYPGVEAHERYERGQLSTWQLLALIRDASIVVGGPGWIVPAALATQTPMIVIGGGQGAANAPDVLADRRLDSSRVRWIYPDAFCRCLERDHDCNKAIFGFVARFRWSLSQFFPVSQCA